MRAALAFLLMSSAAIAAEKPGAYGPELDNSPRARTYSIWNTITVTNAEFRKMKQRYRPQEFGMWAKRLRQLRPGMTDKQVIRVLRPRTVYETRSGNLAWDTYVLSDAYFAAIFVDPRTDRMISASPPLANSYEIKASHKNPPKT
jgi:hypothetical protein